MDKNIDIIFTAQLEWLALRTTNQKIIWYHQLLEEWNKFEIDCQDSADKRNYDDDRNSLYMKRKGHFLLLRKKLFPVLSMWLSPFTGFLWWCFTRIAHRLIGVILIVCAISRKKFHAAKKIVSGWERDCWCNQCNQTVKLSQKGEMPVVISWFEDR